MALRLSIIGGSGFVGRAIVDAARDLDPREFKITVACRHPERSRDLMVEGAHLLYADIVDGTGLAKAVQDADCVVNLVGLLFEKGRYTFQAVHVEGTKNVLKACQEAGVKQYLHMSALGADPTSPSRYARTKAEAEELVRNSTLNWTIFRPSIIYGPRDSFFNKFKAMSRFSPVLPVIEGNTRFQPIWVEDVARAFVQSIDKHKVAGQCFELGGPRIYTFRELLEYLMQCLNRRRLLVPVPRPMARILAAILQYLPNPPLTPDQLILLQKDNIVHGPAYPEVFGKPAALEDILPSYITGGQADWLQHRLDESRKLYWNVR